MGALDFVSKLKTLIDKIVLVSNNYHPVANWNDNVAITMSNSFVQHEQIQQIHIFTNRKTYGNKRLNELIPSVIVFYFVNFEGVLCYTTWDTYSGKNVQLYHEVVTKTFGALEAI